MRKIALLILASTISVSAHAADYTDQLWGTVAVEWVSDKTLERHPQEVNWARRSCGAWASNLDDPKERQQLYFRCLKDKLPADFYRFTDLTNKKAVKERYK